MCHDGGEERDGHGLICASGNHADAAADRTPQAGERGTVKKIEMKFRVDC